MLRFNKIFVSANDKFKYFSHKNYAVKVLAFIILLYFGTSIIVYIFEYIVDMGDSKQIFEIYTQGLSQILFLFLPTIYFARKSSVPTKKLLRISKIPSIKIFLIAVFGILILQVFSSSYLIVQKSLIPNSFIDLYNSLENNIEELYKSILGGKGTFPFIRALLIGAIIPAFSEETLFRGFFQKSLEVELTAFKAILYSSLIFALIHINPISFIPLFAIGIFLGIIAYATENILLPISLHFLNNAIAVIFLFVPSLTEAENKLSDMPLFSALFLFCLSSVLIFGILYNIVQNKNKNNY